MINYSALFKVSYGLYIISSGDKTKGNGFISNTFFQVTAEPPQFAACCNKDNFTCEIIKKTGAFAVSVLQKDASQDIIERFGYKSGRQFNKMESMSIKYGETGVPIILNECTATLECKVNQVYDVGTHLLFIGDLLHAEILDDSKESLTYSFYREVRKGFSPKNAPTYIDKSKLVDLLPKSKSLAKSKKYQCSACGYIYEEESGDSSAEIKEGTKFSDLPDDWVCPVCGAGKDEFIEV